MSELSDISTENVATTRSPTDNTIMHRVTEKTATSSSLSEGVINTLGIFSPFTMGTASRLNGISLSEGVINTLGIFSPFTMGTDTGRGVGR